MSQHSTTARPYARAVFDLAVSEQTLEKWYQLLYVLSQLSCVPGFQTLICMPSISDDALTDIVTECAAPFVDEQATNLIRLLAQNKRLAILDGLFISFDALKSEYEKTLCVDVISFAPLTDEQIATMQAVLTQKLKRQVEIDVSLDKNLIGGAVIQAGSLVIDGSIRGKINKMRSALLAP